MDDRLLGGNQLVVFPVTTTWIATGNNVGLSLEIARRAVRCRMDAGEEHPELRSDFTHNLLAWAHQNRGELVWSLLTPTRA